MDGYKMRKFRIEGCGRGGELTVGKISQEFYDTCKDMDEEELVEFLYANEGEAIMDNASYYEIDSFEHINSAYADGGFRVLEIIDGEEDYDSEITCEGNYIYCREVYMWEGDPALTEGKTVTPCLTWHSYEKGGFGTYDVELEGDFNPELLQYSVLETEFGEFIDEVYYDQQLLEADYDYACTTGKGTFAKVGTIVEEWWDDPQKFSEEYLKDLFAEALEG